MNHFEDQEEIWWGRCGYEQSEPSDNTESFQGNIQAVCQLIDLNKFKGAYDLWLSKCASVVDGHQEHYRVQNEFFFRGQLKYAFKVMKKSVLLFHEESKRLGLSNLGIRFLREYTHAIGHIALLDIYVKGKKLGLIISGEPILVTPAPVPNWTYLNYWREYLPNIVQKPVGLSLIKKWLHLLEDRISPILNDDGKIDVNADYVGANKQVQILSKWEDCGYAPLLKIKEKEQLQGWEVLKILGIPSDAWFVALHVREGGNPARVARDAQVESYDLAIKAVVDRGGWVIRMGNPSMTPLEATPGLIDYAHSSYQSEWMDVFLWALCRFYIGTPSGPAWVPPTFGVPCVTTNWNGFQNWRWYIKDLCIPKLMWTDKEKRYLTFEETYDCTGGMTESSSYLEHISCRWIDNTREELRDIVIEMLDRKNIQTEPVDQEIQLHKRFQKLLKVRGIPGRAQIGTEFLKKWQKLLPAEDS